MVFFFPTNSGDWGRPPNFLLVDFYNEGSTNGSVFEVAARANNVTYTRKCCGTTSLAYAHLQPRAAAYLGLVAAALAAALVV